MLRKGSPRFSGRERPSGREDRNQGGSFMVTFESRFDVLPGKLRDYERYVKGSGKGIWLKFKGGKGVRGFKSMLGGSPPQQLVQGDLESLAAREKILTDPTFR